MNDSIVCLCCGESACAGKEAIVHRDSTFLRTLKEECVVKKTPRNIGAGE